MTYNIYQLGKITKFEASTIYRAMKEGKIKVLPETISRLYDDAGSYVDPRIAKSNYQQDYLYYDRIYSATAYILEGEIEMAQEELILWEENEIKYATKKSSFYKYQD